LFFLLFFGFVVYSRFGIFRFFLYFCSVKVVGHASLRDFYGGKKELS